MNGYSKINRSGNSHKLRSTDFPDFFSFPETLKSTGKITRTEEPKQIENEKAQKSSPERAEEEEEEEEEEDGEAVGEHRDGEKFGVVLGRSASVSSSSAATGLHGTMKKALSMRRSSSVSERYCRIHDQYVALAPPIGEDGEGESNGGGRRSVMRWKKKKKQSGGGGKILRACKRLLGF